MIKKFIYFSLLCTLSILKGQSIYVDAINGDDLNLGTQEFPIRTLQKAVEKVNKSFGHLTTEVIVKEGIYVIDSAVVFKPSINYSISNRFIIRAEVLPGEPNWTPARMPVILPTLRNLRDDPEGKWSNGIQVEVSHATIQGLKIMGSPIYEHLEKNKIVRSYPIVRENGDLEDLLITQCLFVGDEQVLPLHMGIYAEGNKVTVDHCTFYNCKIGVLFANYSEEETSGHALTNNLFVGSYGTALWIMNSSTDFIFSGNSIINSNYALILESGSTKKYKIENSLFANVRNMIGKGAGPLLKFSPLNISTLQIGPGVELSDKVKEIYLDQSKKAYLHILQNGQSKDFRSGLFK